MIRILDSPFLVFIVSLLAQWSAAYVGDVLRRTVEPVKTEARADLDTVLSATLTLLAWLHLFDGGEPLRPAQEL